jgi:isovaleryl-CoA dehydrogenase
MISWQDALDVAVRDVVAPSAEAVDREGRFPTQSIAALREAGILGLTCATEVGGGGGDLGAAAEVIERIARACGSTAMVVLMHYAATAAIEAHGPEVVRRQVASGRHLSTLAFSEVGSRSHFWASESMAVADGAAVRLEGEKSWVTACHEVTSYVLSTRPVAGDGPMTLWLVPAGTPGLEPGTGFDGLGLRGNDSVPLGVHGVTVDGGAQLGSDGGGLDLALSVILPVFLVLSAAFSAGLMEETVQLTAAHLGSTRLSHLNQRLVDQPGPRGTLGRMRVTTDGIHSVVSDTLAALSTGRPDAMLRVLEVKAAAAEAAVQVTDDALRECGGAAFRREVGVERRFRDSRAARVMAPTSSALFDFVGRIVAGLPLFDA